LKGQVAIVTGGSSGIGRATAVRLAQEGTRVVIVGRNDAHVRETVEMVKRLGPRTLPCLGLVLDVGCEADMDELARQTICQFGSIDILVHCAGIAKSSGSQRHLPYPVAQLPLAEWDEVMRTNLRGTFLSNRAVLPTMMARKSGIIINLASSPGGITGQPFAAVYCASKFGVLGLSESLADEVRQYGIKVCALFPDAIETPLLQGSTLERRLGKPLPADRVADLIVCILALPGDAVLMTSRRLSHCILRRTPQDLGQWDR
jgi:NAD(P)-dependent dehydrogenase (short-subunit alcohol dehydrogenase family)